MKTHQILTDCNFQVPINEFYWETIAFEDEEMELREPKKGEWFMGYYMDFPKQAEYDIANPYFILKRVEKQP